MVCKLKKLIMKQEKIALDYLAKILIIFSFHSLIPANPKVTIELFFSIILSLAGISCILELYLKFLEITEDSERIIIGVMKTSPIRFREETFQKVSFFRTLEKTPASEYFTQKKAA